MHRPCGLITRVLIVLLAITIVLASASPASAQTASALTEIQKRGTVRVGWGIFFPYMYRDPRSNELTGFNVEFFTELARELKVKLEWVEDSWATMIAGLQSGKFDVTLMAVTLPRALAVTYSDPILKQPLGLMILKKEVDKYRTWHDLDKPDKRITTTLGANVDLFVTKKFRQAQIIRVKAGPDSIAQVLTGKADAWANSYEAFALVQREHPELAVVPGPSYGATPLNLVVRQGDFVLRDWLNHFIAEVKETGVLDRLVEKYGLYKWAPSN
jgi:cyclohexadienyl dehydratase